MKYIRYMQRRVLQLSRKQLEGRLIQLEDLSSIEANS